VSAIAAAQPLGHAVRACPPLTEVSGEQGECSNQESREAIEIEVEPPASTRLDHDPTVAEVLATLNGVFGQVEVLTWPSPPAYSTARDRLVTLTGRDFHQAVDQLDRDTCLHGGCRPRQPCRRHRRRTAPASSRSGGAAQLGGGRVAQRAGRGPQPQEGVTP
jgi:hypothetical protein